MKRKELIKNLSLEIYSECKQLILNTEVYNEIMAQVEINGVIFEIDYNSDITTSRSIIVNDLEVRSVYNTANVLLSNVRNELNKELYKILNK